MSIEFSVFKKFPTIEQANEIASLLEENNIQVTLVNNSPALDITFSGNTLQNEFELKILPKDFEKAISILNNEVDISLDQLDKNHYLFEFSVSELFDILLKPDEWSEFDFLLARKILESKGEKIDSESLRKFYKQRIIELSKPEEVKKHWIILGYLLSILGGVIGIAMGWYLWSYKKPLPNGQKVFYFSSSDRVNGKLMFFIGIVAFSISLSTRFFNY